jgi:hypothetical protein
MVTVRIARLCEQLWQQAGGPEPFPRDLQTLFAWVLPIGIMSLPSLWTRDVEHWLREHGLVEPTGPERPLRACLLATRDNGCIFIDAADPPDERRFSLAHEIGHFLLDHHLPRHRLLAAVGPSLVGVLDGERAARPEERVTAVLAGAPLGPRLQLMARGPQGIVCGAAAECERAADEFALELLAPESAVLAALACAVDAGPYAEREAAARALVRNSFGLPDPIAGRYASRLLHEQSGGPSTIDWLSKT